MDKVERDRLLASIENAEDKLRKGLISGDEASQLRRMIWYYMNRIKKEYREYGE